VARRRILSQLFPYYLVMLAISLVAATLYSAHLARSLYMRSTEETLLARARLAEPYFAGHWGGVAETGLDSLAKALGSAAGARVTVVLASGEVAGDSDADFRRMENHGDRPEIIRALAGSTGRSVRYSDTERCDMMYVAVPLREDGAIAGALRVSVPLSLIERSLRGLYARIAAGGLVVALLAALASYVVARRIARPLVDLREGIEKFEREGLGYRLPGFDLEEARSLAEVVNDMAERLDERIKTGISQLNEQEAVFSSMVEGLIVVDNTEKITKVNRAAERLLDMRSGAAIGMTIQEVVRNPQLQGFVTKALAADEPVEGEIVLRGNGGDRYLAAHGAPLRDDEERRTGAVIVLNDVTKLERLERVRREFVANVSHELRTPITSIKGFVETLRDGAMRRPADAQKFLEIVAKQADRMNSIIEDLLLLSRVEQDTREAKVVLESAPVRAVVLEAVQVCEPKARAKDISIAVDCPEGIAARINTALLEQAVINLLDNAIKYSEPGRPVNVEAGESAGEVFITVRDRGSGIEPEHLPRIFERFYRVDKARSRTLGGTGLGLAIVKHIAQAHGGAVTVESAPGSGSAFTIRLPKSPGEARIDA